MIKLPVLQLLIESESEVLEEIACLGNSMGLEVDEDEVHELVEEHEEEFSTDKLKKPQILEHTEVVLEISSEEDVESEQVISTSEIKDMLAMWEKLSSLIEKKVSTIDAALFNDPCLTHFRNI